jgi:hypothetical protein
MASTYSDLKIELIGTGEQVGTWGSTTNTNLGTAIEEAITGSADVTFSSADVTLTLTNTNGTQAARNLRLVCTGTSGGARNLILGSGCQINKLYLVQNNLADTVTIKNTTGTGVAIPAGEKQFVFNNGINIIEAVSTTVDLNSDVTGTLPIANGGTNASTAGTARTNLGLGTIATQNSNSVSITGGSITGITDLAVADGGTGASTSADARTNLDVPSRSGSGASGTWAINISGNAAGNAGTVTNGVYTTNFTGANQSLSTNGYQKFPGGLIIQWGTISVASRSSETDFGNISFPIAFPNACRNVTATLLTTESANQADSGVAIRSQSTTSFNPYLISTDFNTRNYGVSWIAIGD